MIKAEIVINDTQISTKITTDGDSMSLDEMISLVKSVERYDDSVNKLLKEIFKENRFIEKLKNIAKHAKVKGKGDVIKMEPKKEKT